MEEKQGYVIVTPGTLLATLKKSGEGTFILNGKTYSKYFGIKREGYRISVIPFNQSYKPKRGDKIIGKIKDFNYPFFIIDIEAPNPAYLHLMDISRYNTRQEQIMKIYKPGLWIYSEVSELSDRVRLSMKFRESKILSGGRIAYISPSKVPRVVGKGGSMIKMIQDKTKCKVLIGQNGIIWINGDNTGLV
ncbi:MAG TPA: RNA-binding protein, partial [Candidatus Aenigmarchaeota archaeon]|nr:RNA-binding protein [Candidatus Aenigmarchaeota archaeon]